MPLNWRVSFPSANSRIERCYHGDNFVGSKLRILVWFGFIYQERLMKHGRARVLPQEDPLKLGHLNGTSGIYFVCKYMKEGLQKPICEQGKTELEHI